NQLQSLVQKERIITTLPKAKELRPIAERVITRGKSDTLHARRWVLRWVLKRDLVKKIFDEISPRFAERPGGYLRIVKLGPRQGDGAEMAVIELVDRVEPAGESKGAAAKKKGRAAARKAAASKASARLAGKSAKKVAEDAAESEADEEIGVKEKPARSKREPKAAAEAKEAAKKEKKDKKEKKEGHKEPKDHPKASTKKAGSKSKPTRQKTG
ncbi:MAG TPA: 50S ribosomal protein L17, partial [Dongiaceae bacterium]